MIIKGVVTKGEGKSRELGFPTVNIALKNSVDSGVYSGRVFIGSSKYNCVVFVRKTENILEAHIFDFNNMIYDIEVTIEIGQKIREVMEFKNNDELIRQINLDINKVAALK